jgi:hypothetical protein
MVGLGTRFGDRYVLGPVLGWGGSSRVHQAHDERLGREVALKLVHVDDEEALARLRREAAVAARVANDNVIEILDTGTDPEPYVVMQLVTGRSLTEVIRQQGPLPPGALADLARGLLTGSAAIHGAGIVHRDISPSNVLIGDDGRVRITDFGLARGAGDPTITDTGMVMGTASFVAPERRHGRPATPASDLYEIGGTLFYAATGQAPARTERLPDGLPFRALLEQLLRTDPDDRPDSAEQALSQLPGPGARSSTEVLTQMHDPAVATTRVVPREDEQEPAWRDRLDAFWSEDAEPAIRDARGRMSDRMQGWRQRLGTDGSGPSRRTVLLVIIAIVAAVFVLNLPTADPAAPPAYDPGRAPAENADDLADWLRDVTD